MDYTTLANVHAWGTSNNVPMGANSDTLISTLITNYSAAIDEYCSQRFSQATYTGVNLSYEPFTCYVDEKGFAHAELDTPVVSTLSALSWRDVNQSRVWSNISLVGNTDVDVESSKKGALIHVYNMGNSSINNLSSTGSFGDSRDGFQMMATYTGGYAGLLISTPPTLPLTVQEAATELVYYVYSERMSLGGKQQMSPTGFSYIMPMIWPKDVIRKLNVYKREFV